MHYSILVQPTKVTSVTKYVNPQTVFIHTKEELTAKPTLLSVAGTTISGQQDGPDMLRCVMNLRISLPKNLLKNLNIWRVQHLKRKRKSRPTVHKLKKWLKI